MIEIFLYGKDYYELKIFECYVRYEIHSNNFSELYDGKHDVIISYDDKITYEIKCERNTIFKFYYLKKIKCTGTINFMIVKQYLLD